MLPLKDGEHWGLERWGLVYGVPTKSHTDQWVNTNVQKICMNRNVQHSVIYKSLTFENYMSLNKNLINDGTSIQWNG